MANKSNSGDKFIVLGSAYAVTAIPLICLHLSSLLFSDIEAYSATCWISSLFLLITCLTLLVFNIRALGLRSSPDDPWVGRYRASIGTLFGIHLMVLMALFSHQLDKQIWIYQIFWLQILALPGAYLATSSAWVAQEVRGKEEMIAILEGYVLVNILAWLDLENSSESDLVSVLSRLAGLLILMALCIVFVTMAIRCVCTTRLETDSQGKKLTIAGTLVGVSLMTLALIPAKIAGFMSAEDSWVRIFLFLQSGALPGAYFVGGCPYLGKLESKMHHVLPRYSVVSS